ncbi:MAG: hypothetical protein O3A63_14235 [Proteobacteria bacterium]|nr:hypothetical protein [Pseudomonadota bacterium]
MKNNSINPSMIWWNVELYTEPRKLAEQGRKKKSNSMALCADDGLPAECGLVFAIMFPAGEYELFRFLPAEGGRRKLPTTP